jgi:hypothetical protein
MKKITIVFIITLIAIFQINVFAVDNALLYKTLTTEAQKNTGTFQVKYINIENEELEQILFYNKIYNMYENGKDVISHNNDNLIKEKIKKDIKYINIPRMAMRSGSKADEREYKRYMDVFEEFYDFLTEKKFEQIKYLASIIDLENVKKYKNANGSVIRTYAVKKDLKVYVTSYFNPYERDFAVTGETSLLGIASFTSDFISVPKHGTAQNSNTMGYKTPNKIADKKFKQVSEETALGWYINIGFASNNRFEKGYIESFTDINNFQEIGIWTRVIQGKRCDANILWEGPAINMTGIGVNFICDKIK